MRQIIEEVIECRHCVKIFRTSEMRLRNAMLCQNCFDIREEYRKNNPREYSDRTEINCLGDTYGERKYVRTVVCASCGVEYDLIPKDYVDISLEDQQKHYDWCVEFQKGYGKELKPFKPILFLYEHAPKGWKNEILCKTCFDNIQIRYGREIYTLNEEETEKLERKKIEAAAERDRHRRIEEAARFQTKIYFVLIPLMILFLIISLGDCSGLSGNAELDPRHF